MDSIIFEKLKAELLIRSFLLTHTVILSEHTSWSRRPAQVTNQVTSTINWVNPREKYLVKMIKSL
ncbi:unnamed protein product [Dovyalis caffra]|uniref:Uncharacterized protein n=1 Tax=Dovyalis caffra TaxID=77055 RepID=A0AAV1S9L5_9ROSI|nr:unnamed protein product [Dovyalis caffra]